MPFDDTIGRLLYAECSIKLWPNKRIPGAYWCYFLSEDEFALCKEWKERQGSRVFLRDCLDLSLALGINISRNVDGLEGYTRLGGLEARAKSAPDEEAIDELVTAFSTAISSLPHYRDAKLIAAVPPRPGKPYDLPSVLAGRVASTLSLMDLTARFRFARTKATVKEAAVTDKWNAWERSGLTFSPPFSNQPRVIVIDDKYQSGTSIQYVASVLRAAGAGEIYGLCAVKTLRDTDNA